MNDTTQDTVDMVEILDEQGNPTGQFSPREATQAEVKVTEVTVA